MTVNVDHDRARAVLTEATEAASEKSYRVPQDMETKIEQIIGHTHLTYKYVLLNGLLAKATDPNTDPIALQAGAALEGAFDARSLCHKVFVPFEQTVLEKRLGGSNEPFLNKPARYTHLSLDNAVRRGKDRLTLERLIAVFEMVNEQGNADQALLAALYNVLALESRVVIFDTARFAESLSQRATLNLCKALIERSCEGETLALTVAILFEMLSKNRIENPVVISHPANQAGSSSKEISDVDVFYEDGKTILFCAEAKDKDFTKADIDHAAGKVAEAGHGAMLFIYGPNATTTENLVALVEEYEAKGFDLTFLTIKEFMKSVVSLTGNINIGQLIEITNKHLEMMRAKEVTITHCKQVLSRV
ncbi:MAG: restriction endonuclease, SacI family [Rhodobacteraceae bacterium]|nr:restriction endonuclease, SacI family [Paracoccaceae bacterium]